jgi:hypothetical protein
MGRGRAVRSAAAAPGPRLGSRSFCGLSLPRLAPLPRILDGQLDRFGDGRPDWAAG